MQKKPEGFRYLGLDFKIRWDQIAADMNRDLGCSINAHQTVLVDSSLPEQRQRQILLHELTHVAVVDMLSPGNLPSEDQITAIAAGLYQIMVDNPSVLNYIFRGRNVRN